MNGHSRPFGHGDIAFDISPTGKQIVFSAVGDGGRDLYLLDLKTRRVVQLIKSPDYEGSPAFSPDGKSIVYAAGTVGDKADHLFIRSLNGSSVKQVTAASYNDASPSFSTDGSQIIFARNLTYSWGGLAASWGRDKMTCVVKPDGTQLRRATSKDLIALSSDLKGDGRTTLPDGKQIAFIKLQNAQIHIRNANGKFVRQLTHVNGSCRKLRLTRDGKRILFLAESWPNGPSGAMKYSLWEVETAGGNTHQIADSQLFDNPLTWSP